MPKDSLSLKRIGIVFPLLLFVMHLTVLHYISEKQIWLKYGASEWLVVFLWEALVFLVLNALCLRIEKKEHLWAVFAQVWLLVVALCVFTMVSEDLLSSLKCLHFTRCFGKVFSLWYLFYYGMLAFYSTVPAMVITLVLVKTRSLSKG